MNKNHYFKSLCVAAAFLVAGFGVRAQESETSVYINGMLPTAAFNDAINFEFPNQLMNREQAATGATAGLGITARYGLWFDLGVGQLEPFAEASFLWNSVKGSVRDHYDNIFSPANVRAKAPAYFNLPIMLGIKYRYDLNATIRPYAEVALGCDFLFISGNGLKDGVWYKYKPTGNLCWMVGLGSYIGEFVSVGLFYEGLGGHLIDYTRKTADVVGPINTTVKRNIGEFGIRLGFHF